MYEAVCLYFCLFKSESTSQQISIEKIRNKQRRFSVQAQTFLMAYLGSSGMTRRIFPSQNSATTRSFFQPWKHNRGKELQLQANNHNNNLIPRSKILPVALTASLIPTSPHGLYLGGLLRYTKVHPTMFGSSCYIIFPLCF